MQFPFGPSFSVLFYAENYLYDQVFKSRYSFCKMKESTYTKYRIGSFRTVFETFKVFSLLGMFSSLGTE